MGELAIRTTPIPGLLVVDLPVHRDGRGWFKENWQRAKMTAIGLPDFAPVQHSVAYNRSAGVTRGIHAEPWDKFVSVASGRTFCAWVDLRKGPTFGTLHTEELDESRAAFVPRGVGNAYQTLVDSTVYSYLVNSHWSPDASYTLLNVADDTVAVPWPIPLDKAEISAKDRAHPPLSEIEPIAPCVSVLIVGKDGQVGRALTEQFPDATAVGRDQLDLTAAASVRAFDFTPYDVVINAAAFTDVDGAETATGRRSAWATNATGVAMLARVAIELDFTLVHFSTDYVFDGTAEEWSEDSPLAPLNVYGSSKAAGDLAVSVVPRHYILRTSWVVGEGPNFVRTMAQLAHSDTSPSVVADQHGRLTLADELAQATRHLLSAVPEYGVYNVTNSGSPTTWLAIAREVFSSIGRDPASVTPTTAAEYAETREHAATRPGASTLDLGRIHRAGYSPRAQGEALSNYLSQLQKGPS
jgi:dTDP-4-dehydrorhamnose 3,5-epimerase/reductase